MQQRKPPRACGHVLHTEPDLYVLISYQPRDGEPNYCRASCEYVDGDNPARGDGLAVHLSLFDAYLNATFISKPGESFHPIHAVEFDPRELIRNNRGQFHTFLHCGWAAHDGQLVMRRKGNLASLYGLSTSAVAPEVMAAIDLMIDKNDLAAYDRMREKAGLFAHAESHAAFLKLDERRRQQAVALAIQRIPGTVDVDQEINQMAIYDPEAAQWHFLPIDVFHQGSENSGQQGNTANVWNV